MHRREALKHVKHTETLDELELELVARFRIQEMLQAQEDAVQRGDWLEDDAGVDTIKSVADSLEQSSEAKTRSTMIAWFWGRFMFEVIYYGFTEVEK